MVIVGDIVDTKSHGNNVHHVKETYNSKTAANGSK